jgi:hypothetical protein
VTKSLLIRDAKDQIGGTASLSNPSGRRQDPLIDPK